MLTGPPREQANMVKWNKYAETINDLGGAIYGLCSETKETAQFTQKVWFGQNRQRYHTYILTSVACRWRTPPNTHSNRTTYTVCLVFFVYFFLFFICVCSFSSSVAFFVSQIKRNGHSPIPCSVTRPTLCLTITTSWLTTVLFGSQWGTMLAWYNLVCTRRRGERKEEGREEEKRREGRKESPHVAFDRCFGVLQHKWGAVLLDSKPNCRKHVGCKVCQIIIILHCLCSNCHWQKFCFTNKLSQSFFSLPCSPGVDHVHVTSCLSLSRSFSQHLLPRLILTLVLAMTNNSEHQLSHRKEKKWPTLQLQKCVPS